MSTFITPRKIGWLLVLSLSTWFAITAPKTPQQFYAAANRAQERERQRLLAAFDQMDRARAADAAKWLQLDTLNQAMRVMELNADCAANPARVRAHRAGVLLGAYGSTARTKDALLRRDAAYRSLSAEFERHRAEVLRDKKYAAAYHHLQQQYHAGGDEPRRRLIREMQGLFWRNFQARLFWPKFNRKSAS
ncbi:MAG: hypothetical protein LBK60_04055 [Verrucomicrobiales bacterium]|jgi:hypothetical protein|nr:hypothetical protein [Verrucomicrobiales bacterium]